MQEKTIEIVAPEGYEVDKEGSSFEKIVFRALPDKGLPKRWEELKELTGYYVDTYSTVDRYPFPSDAVISARNLWPTKEEAEASIALAQLCQLRDRYNGGWKPDWEDADDEKACIVVHKGRAQADLVYQLYHVLHFKSEELRDKFMENFSDLIEKAKPLLG